MGIYKEENKKWARKFKDSEFLRFKIGFVRWTYIEQALKTFKIKTVLEFGSGLSTILFERCDCLVESYETSRDYINSIQHMTKCKIRQWDGKSIIPLYPTYDLTFIDGTLPREPQIKIGTKYSNVIIVDDAKPIREIDGFVRVDDAKRLIGIFVRGFSLEA